MPFNCHKKHGQTLDSLLYIADHAFGLLKQPLNLRLGVYKEFYFITLFRPSEASEMQ